MTLRRRLLAPIGMLLVSACGPGEKGGSDAAVSAPPAGEQLFTRMPSAYTGVAFSNPVTDTREVNVFTYRNHYNGGGVAIGDLTGDSLPELVLTANEGGPRVYLNKGSFRFADVTDAARMKDNGAWTTGVTMADVNGDGRLDVYVCHAGNDAKVKRANQLFINQGVNSEGVPTFTEEAEAYGLMDGGFSTHAAFTDYDRDGDLDLFLINNSPRAVNSFGLRNTRTMRHPTGGDKLYRNDADRFVDVSAAAGIYGAEIGFALGVVVGDVNRDGWPDIYVSNDFFERDYLYLNNGNGGFTETLASQFPYTSYFSMGLDIADVNNDGWPDIYTTDMLPEDEYRLRSTSSFEGWDVYQAKVQNGYHAQFMRNMLQLNNQDGTFSDIGQMAGVARTDWSWSALMADFDLDGYKDVFVTNGLAKDVTSQDYINSIANQAAAESVFVGKKVDYLRLVDAMSSTRIPNYMFRNRGDLTFASDAKAWGLDTPSFSNGAAYGDLDGDGALDLVVNNVNDEAFVYRNNVRTLQPANRPLHLTLVGEGQNTGAVGARVTLFAGAEQRMQELQPTRGFQSSVDYALIFGMGARDSVDSIHVRWPDWRLTRLGRTATGQRLTIRQSTSVQAPLPTLNTGTPLLTDVTGQAGVTFAHRENDFVDFDRERLIPRLVSTDGPGVAVADVNGDGLDDLWIGGAKGQPGSLQIQRRDGTFSSGSGSAFDADSVSEDVGALFFDANGDRAPDLYVVSGGNEFSDGAPALQDRLYLNDRRGGFAKAAGALPDETLAGSKVAAADYDGDGDQDLFVGGRVVPWKYGRKPRQMLLVNDGRGRFSDATDKLAPALQQTGMVTDAVWTDVTGDGRADLVVVGDWMPVTVYKNEGGGRLARATTIGLEKSHGWWNRIIAGDFTGDGRTDFVLGNFGLNQRLSASATEPVTMHVKDFVGNGFDLQLVSSFWAGKSYPLPLRDDLIRAIPPLKASYINYSDYATQTLADVFPDLSGAEADTVHLFATSLARQNADGSFSLEPLPREAQLAPVFGIASGDVNGDGKQDLILGGNFGGFKPDLAPMAASYGQVLLGSGNGKFVAEPATRSGFRVPGEVRDIRRLRTARGDLYLVARNNDRPLFYRPRGGSR